MQIHFEGGNCKYGIPNVKHFIRAPIWKWEFLAVIYVIDWIISKPNTYNFDAMIAGISVMGTTLHGHFSFMRECAILQGY